MDTLLDSVRRYADRHANGEGLAQSPIPGLALVRATAPSGLLHAVYRPLVCLLVQGSKHVTMGTQDFAFSAGDSLLVTADVPIVSRITRASVARRITRWCWNSILPSSRSLRSRWVPSVRLMMRPCGSSRPMPKSPKRLRV